MIEKPSLFFSFDPRVLDTTSEVHKKNLAACKDDNQQITYVFHAVRTKNYGVDLSKNGMNLLGRVQRAMSYLYNSVVLFLFWNTVSGEETKKDIQKVIQKVLKPPAVQPEVVDVPVSDDGILEGEPVEDSEEVVIENLDPKWMHVKDWLKQFTEKNPCNALIDHKEFRVLVYDNKKIVITMYVDYKEHELIIKNSNNVWVGEGNKEIVKYQEQLLDHLYKQTPEGVIDSFPLEKRVFSGEEDQSAQLDYLLKFLEKGHNTPPNKGLPSPDRLLCSVGEKRFSFYRNGNKQEICSCQEVSFGDEIGQIEPKTFCKKDATWVKVINGTEKQLDEEDQKELLQMVKACGEHTYQRAVKISDRQTSRFVLDQNKCKFLKKISQKYPRAKYENFNIWSKDGFFCIQNKEMWSKAIRLGRLDLQIDDGGNLAQVRVDGQRIDALPNSEKGFAEMMYKFGLKNSVNCVSKQDADYVRIETVEGGIEDISLHLFASLVPQLRTLKSLKSRINVRFKTWELENSPGIDAGGLTRQLISHIFGGLLTDSACKLHMDYAWQAKELPMPKAEQAVEGEGEGWAKYCPALDKEESTQYQHVGYMQMYCFNSDQLNDDNPESQKCLSGQIFHPDTFLAIQKISYDQASATKPDWNNVSWTRVIEQLVKGKGDQDIEFWNYLQEDNPSKELTNHMMQQIQELGISDWEEGTVVSADMVKEFIDKYIKEKYASYLPALHAIAHGMCLRIQDTRVGLNQQGAWETFCAAKDVHITIQGQLDRQLISKSFQFKDGLVPNDIIIKKVEWLKKWIKEEASEDEVKLFLKYVTGAPVLGVSHLIIDKGGDTPLPVAHTCFNRLDISDKYHTHGDNRDDTPEYFIASLKNAMLQAFGGEGSYSAG